MLDLENERPLSLSQAAAALPGRPHLSTIHRWRLRGVRGVKLETCLVGGKRVTTHEALLRFMQRTTDAAEPRITSAEGGRGLRREEGEVETALSLEGL
jgi:hypothetical protein